MIKSKTISNPEIFIAGNPIPATHSVVTESWSFVAENAKCTKHGIMFCRIDEYGRKWLEKMFDYVDLMPEDSKTGKLGTLKINVEFEITEK